MDRENDAERRISARCLSMLEAAGPGGMARQLAELLEDAPSLPSNGGVEQAPALECQVMLRGGSGFVGALSLTDDGVIRMLSPAASDPRNPRSEPMLAEIFFSVAELAAIVLPRKVAAAVEAPRLFRG